MNLDQFYIKLENPALLDKNDISSLKDLSIKHPYSQLFSLLYLKALAVNKDLHFEEELQKNAFKISDRSKLFGIIQSNSTFEQFIEQSEDPFIEPEIETEEPSTGIPIITEPEVDLTQENSVEEFEVREDTIEEIKENDIAPHKNVDAELEKEFLSNILASSYSLEKEFPNVEKLEEKPQEINLEENRTFTSWLKINSKTDSSSNLDENKKNVSEIINKFIEVEPERKKVNSEFYSAPKKAKESVDESKLLYSETLANIYALQGNYPKAIQAFENLILTIPEKKLYFAKKIAELTKKINS